MRDADNQTHRHSSRAPLPAMLVAPVRGLGRIVLRRGSRNKLSQVANLAQHGVVDWGLYRRGRRTDADVDLDEAHQISRDHHDAFLWIGLYEPNPEEFERIAFQLELHPLAVEDAVHAHQRPKIEWYGDTLFAVLKTVRYVDTTEVIEAGEIMLFVARDFVVTVRHGIAGSLTEVRHELEGRQDVLSKGTGAVFWAIADRVVDDYSDAIEALNIDIEEVEAAVFDPEAPSPTERIYKLKREVMEFRRAVDPLASELMKLSEDGGPEHEELITRDIIPYIRDVHDHAIRSGGRLEAFDSSLSDALQAHVAQVTLRQNEDMRKITAWAAILATITSIAGVYGMNFDHMPELHWVIGYPLALAAMAASSLLLLMLFRKRHWL